jgi:hypothetical protein
MFISIFFQIYHDSINIRNKNREASTQSTMMFNYAENEPSNSNVSTQKVVCNFSHFTESSHTNFDAISELLDNSKDAKADTIKIELKTKTSLNQLNPVDKSNEHRINGGTAKESNEVSLRKPALFVIDNGHGITMPDVKQIFNLGTHNGTGSPEGKRAGSEAVGQYGLGLKTSISRIGFYSMVLTRSSVTSAKEKLLPKNTLIYRIAIWPFNERKDLEQKSGDVPMKTADLLLEVVWSFDPVDTRHVQSFDPTIQNYETIENSEAVKFLMKNGPFDDLNDTKSMKKHLESMVKLFATKIHMETLQAVLNKRVCSRIKNIDVIEKMNKYSDKTEIINDKYLSGGCGTILTVWDFKKSSDQVISYNDHDILDHGSCGNDLDETNGVWHEDGFYSKSLNNHISTLYANVSMTYHEYMTESAVRPMTTIFVQGRQIHPIYLRSLMHFETIKVGSWKPKLNNSQKKAMSFEIGYLVPEYGSEEISYYRGVHYFYKNRRIVCDQPKYTTGVLSEVYQNKYPFCMLVNVTDFVNPNHSKNGLNGEWKVGNKNHCFEFMKKELKKYGELIYQGLNFDDVVEDKATTEPENAENVENDDRSVQSVPISLNSIENENLENVNHDNSTEFQIGKTPENQPKSTKKLVDLSSAKKLAVMQCSICRKIRRFALEDAPPIFGWENRNGIYRARKSENAFKCDIIGSVDECNPRSSRIRSGKTASNTTDINTKMLKPIGGNAEQKWLKQENSKFLKQLKLRVAECVEKRYDAEREEDIARFARERKERDDVRDRLDSEKKLRASERSKKLRLELKLNDSITDSQIKPQIIEDDDELEITEIKPANEIVKVNPKIELLERLERVKAEHIKNAEHVNLVSSDDEIENDSPKKPILNTPEIENPEVDMMPNTPEFNGNDLDVMDEWNMVDGNEIENTEKNSLEMLEINAENKPQNVCQNSLARNIENRGDGFYREANQQPERRKSNSKKRKITNVQGYEDFDEVIKKDVNSYLKKIENRSFDKNKTLDAYIRQLKKSKD